MAHLTAERGICLCELIQHSAAPEGEHIKIGHRGAAWICIVREPESRRCLDFREIVTRMDTVEREAAGAALAQAGYESDPRLRGMARRTLERTMDFLRSPLGAKPWIRIGNQQVLSPDAFPPSIHALQMYAHMPLFRNEHYEGMEMLYRWLCRALPRQEQMQQVGKTILPVPTYVMGDRLPHRNAVEADVPAAIAWLEVMARLGFLKRNENWTKMYEQIGRAHV